VRRESRSLVEYEDAPACPYVVAKPIAGDSARPAMTAALHGELQALGSNEADLLIETLVVLKAETSRAEVAVVEHEMRAPALEGEHLIGESVVSITCREVGKGRSLSSRVVPRETCHDGAEANFLDGGSALEERGAVCIDEVGVIGPLDEPRVREDPAQERCVGSHAEDRDPLERTDQSM
jgi:hypothetical protein